MYNIFFMFSVFFAVNVDNDNLGSVFLPTSLVAILDWSFAKCSSLTKMIIPT